VIDVAGAGGDRFWVEGWLYSERNPVLRHLDTTRDGVSRDELCEAVSVLRRDARRAVEAVRGTIVDPDNPMRVELFVPPQLADCDADQWPVEEPGAPGGVCPLGFHHPVVLRPLWRARCTDDRVHAEWARRWVLVAAARGSASGGDGPVWNAVASPGGQVYYALQRRKDAVCAVLGLPPASGGSARVPRYLDDVLRHGFPIVLWLRRAPDDDETVVGGELQRILSDRSPGEIWELVWRERWQNYDEDLSEDHVSRNITLVFDGPVRIPEGVRPPDRADRARAPQRKSNP
jgi:hypothetical protein